MKNMCSDNACNKEGCTRYQRTINRTRRPSIKKGERRKEAYLTYRKESRDKPLII
jgi:hypothetical protein